MSKIGFIGVGTIGAPMANRVLEAHGGLVVYDVSAQACTALAGAGATIVDSIANLAASCETVFMSLPGPKQIEEVISGTHGVLAASGRVKTIIDLSTNALDLNRDIAARCADRGIAYLDAPVSGGKIAAQKGSLAVMVGGDEARFDDIKPLIESFASSIFYLGPSGAGTLAKLVNNQIFLSASVLIQEGFVMGAKAGMDSETLLNVLKASSAGSVIGRAPMLLSRKFDAKVFALNIAAKDIDVALDSAAALGASMPLTSAAATVYHEALAQGLGEEDFYATVKVLEQAAQTEVVAPRKPKSK